MSRTEAKKIAKKYAEELKRSGYNFSAVYLFGSYTKNKNHKWSDIDIAVISNRLKKNREKNRFLLWKIRRKVDTRIEPHGLTPEEFKSRIIPLVHEIKKTGIKVA